MSVNLNLHNHLENHIPVDRAKTLFDRAMKCQAIKDLYERAKLSQGYTHPRGKDWTIKFLPNVEFYAACDHANRSIHLEETLSDDGAFTRFVFELTNATKTHESIKLWDKACRGEVDGEEYAKEVERREFEGCIEHSKVIKIAIREMKLSPSMDIFSRRKNMSFERHWHETQRFTHHAQSYREAFWSIQKPVIAMGFKEKLESVKYNATHFSSKDFFKICFVSLICGTATFFFSSISLGIYAGVITIICAIATRILSPFYSPIYDHFDGPQTMVRIIIVMSSIAAAILYSAKVENLKRTMMPLLLSGSIGCLFVGCGL